MSSRSEQECFDELAELCKSPGYAHAIASLCLRDQVIGFGDALTGNEYSQQFARERLIRTELSTLIGLMLRAPRDLTLPPPKQIAYYEKRSEALLAELHEAMNRPMAEHMKAAVADSSKRKENPFASAEVLREPIFYSAESAYSFQFRDFAEKRYTRDEGWLLKEKGFSPSEAKRVISAICAFINENLVVRLNALRDLPPDKWTILEGFKFSLAEIVARAALPATSVKAVIDAFTFPESGNPTFTSLHEFNEANAFPIIRVDSESYLLFLYGSLAESSYDAPFYWMVTDKAYQSRAMENRGLFTEEFTFDRFERVFGKGRVLKNVDIWESSARKKKVGEIDTLVLFADRAVVVQVKSKKLTLLARKGNDLQLQSDFKSAVQDACDQAIDCSERLASGAAVVTDSEGMPITVSNLRSIHPVCVVSDHYPALSFQARNFLKMTLSGVIQQPLVCDVFFIDVVTEFLNTPLRCLSYLELRAKAGDSILLSHEITALGFHLKQNLWVGGAYQMMMLEDDLSTDVDIAMAARREGVPGETTPPGILTKLRDMSVGRIVEHIELKSDPGAVGIGLELLKLDSESATFLSQGIDKIVAQAKDGKEHDLSVATKVPSGITIHCNSLSDERAAPKLKQHCEIRKYSQKAQTWFGLTLTPDDADPRFGLMLDYPWKQDDEMDKLVEALPKATSIADMASKFQQIRSEKIGRNAPCPCGSGLKYKKCCLRSR